DLGTGEGSAGQRHDAAVASHGVTEIEWLSQSGVEVIDRGQAGVGKRELAGPRACRVVGVRLEWRDSDPHPFAEWQGAEETVELLFALGAIQAEGLALPPRGGRPPDPDEMPLASQGGGGCGPRALALFDFRLR